MRPRLTVKNEAQSFKCKVSVIIPTLNSSRTLQNCLRSIEDQTYPFHEIILIDNFSSDSTIQIAKKFDVKIMLHKSERASARNLGVVNSKGKYIIFVDSDHVLEKNVLEECVDICENENIGMIIIPELFVGDNFWGSCLALWKSQHRYSDIPRFFLKSLVSSVGFLSHDLVFGEDLELYGRLKKSGTRERRCKSRISHFEYLSIRDFVAKELMYSKSFHRLSNRIDTPILSETIVDAFLTFWNVLKSVKRTRLLALGCFLLLLIKTYAWAIGILTPK